MRYIVSILLFVIFFYSLALVLFNNSEVAVNLIFSQPPAMNLGLLLIICLVLGVLIGLLLALQVFRVLQNKWELNRLQKEVKQLQEQLVKANLTIENHEKARSMAVEPAAIDVEPVVETHDTYYKG